MRKTVLALALTAPVAVAGCMTPQQERQVGGALIGGSLGFITAKALDADSDWTGDKITRKSTLGVEPSDLEVA